jgi:hypothetical protein
LVVLRRIARRRRCVLAILLCGGRHGCDGGMAVLLDAALDCDGSQERPLLLAIRVSDRTSGELQAIDRCDGDCGQEMENTRSNAVG